MNMQFKHFLPLTLLFMGLSLSLQAQELRVNEKGEKIIVYPDGTWQYFTNFGVSSGALFDPKDDPNYTPAETGDKYPTFAGTVLPMDNVYANTDEDARKIFIRRSQIAQEAAQIAQQRVREATQQREKLEQELREAQINNAPEETLRNLNTRLTAARNTEKETMREAGMARQEAGKADELTRKGGLLQELKAQAKTNPGPNGTVEPLLEDFYKTVVTLDEATGSIREANNVMVNPPDKGCDVAFEGKDETTSQWRRDMQQELLFTYTDERLRVYLKDKEYLRCEGFMTSMAGFRFLSLQFSFAYPNAREAYGFIEKNSVLIIKLLNGDFITLNAGRMDQGSYDTEKELLTYRVHYPIDRSQLSILRRGELDSMIMFWSSGYEEYEVFNLDFFMNQLNCLEK